MGNTTVYNLKTLLEGKEQKKGVCVEALVTDLESAVAKNGCPYVQGVLADNKLKVGFKCWDTELSDWLSNNSLPEGPFVARILGNFELYEDIPQFIQKGAISVMPEAYIDRYVNVAPIAYEAMDNAIKGAIEQKIVCEPLKEIAGVYYNMFRKKAAFAPYSCEVHSEKMGWLYHVYNCIGKALNPVGDPKIFVDGNGVDMVDREVCICAFLIYYILPFQHFDIDEKTGVIVGKDEVECTLFSKSFNVEMASNSVSAYTNTKEGEQPISEVEFRKLQNLLHVVEVLNNTTSPKTLEAVYCLGIKDLELALSKYSSVLSNMEVNKSIAFSFAGEKRNVVRLH